MQNLEQQPPSNQVFIIVGEPERGKTTIRDIICNERGMLGGSCSDCIFDAWAKLSNQTVPHLRSIPKGGIRTKLGLFGDWLNGMRAFPLDHFPEVAPEAVAEFERELPPSKSAMVQMLLGRGVRAIDGIRRPDEYDAAVAHIRSAGFNLTTMWVETTRPIAAKDLFSLTKERCQPDFVVHNDGTIADLREMVLGLLDGRAIDPNMIEDLRAHYAALRSPVPEPAMEAERPAVSHDKTPSLA